MTTTLSGRRAEHGVPTDVRWITTAGTLDGFAFQLCDADGADVRDLAAGSILSVRTRNSCYRIVIVEPESQRVLVTGGKWFPEPTEVQLVGATGGGSMLKLGWIGVGLRLELRHGKRPMTTSRVETVTGEWSPFDAI